MAVHLSLKWVVMLLGLLMAGGMVALVLLGTMTAREGVNDVVDALIDSVTEQAVMEVERFLVTPVELVDRLVTMGVSKRLYNIERADGWGAKECVDTLMVLNETDYDFAGSIYIVTEHGHMCGLIEQLEEDKFVTTTVPPIEQMVAGNPTWTIPCRYQRSCDNTSGHCLPENFWEPGAAPYWVAGEGTYEGDDKYANYVAQPLDPMYATWAVQQNPGQVNRTVCRPDAVDSLPPCTGAPCPEFNRTYYYTNNGMTDVSLKKTRAGYDPRGRSWYKNSKALSVVAGVPQHIKHYLDIYLCSSGFPCLSAFIPYFVKRPMLGQALTHAGMSGVVVGHSNTVNEMFSPVVDFTQSGGGVHTLTTEALGWNAAHGGGGGAFSEHLAGIAIADYETTVLAYLFQKIKVAKTGSLFMIEKNPLALLISTGFPCAQAESQGLVCFSKPQREDINGDPDRVSAFDPYGGEVPSKIMADLFDIETGSHMHINTVTDKVADIGSKYWVRIVPIRGAGDITGIDWLLLVCIPQDDYLKTVNERNVAMLAVSLCVAGALIVLLVTGTVFVFVKPMMEMTHHFDYACKMQLDVIDAQERSCVSELRFLQKCFTALVKNLKLYKPFLPASCLPDEVCDSDSDTNTATHTSVEHTASRTGHSASTSKLGNSLRATSTMTGGMFKATNLGISGLRSKKVTCLCVNVTNFRSLVNDPDVTAKHATLFTRIQYLIKGSKGVPEPFQGDRLMASFNGSYAVASSLALERGLSTACALAAIPAVDGAAVVCGVSSSEAMCGIMGTDSMRAHSILGSCYGLSVVLMNLTKIFPDAKVLFDSSFTENVRSRYVCRVLDVLPKKKSSGRLVVWEALSQRVIDGGEEWMYQVEEVVRDPHAVSNKEWLRFMKSSTVLPADDLATKKLAQLSRQGVVGLDYVGQDPGYLGLEA